MHPKNTSTNRLPDDNEPATKSYVRKAIDELAKTVKIGFDNTATKDDLKKFATKDDLKKLKDEIIYEFKAVAENIHQDIAGANKDEISFMKEQQLPDHEERIQVIEKRTGVEVGPRYTSPTA